MTVDDVMRKVRGLLKLAEGSKNENEAASAAAAAAKLMETHNLSEAAISIEQGNPESTEEIRDFADPLAKAGARWRGSLGSVLAKSQGCGVYKSGNVYKLYGRASNVEATRYLFDYCAREVDRLALSQRGNGRTWINNYRLGCVDAIRDAIKRERQSARDDMRAKANSENALIVVDSAIARVEEQSKEVFVWGRQKLGLVSRSAGRVNSDPNARSAGRSDGRSIYPGGSGSGSGRIGSGVRRISG